MPTPCTCPTSNLGRPHLPACPQALALWHEYDALARRPDLLTPERDARLEKLRRALLDIGIIQEAIF